MEAFISSIILFAGGFVPRDWALCHGQLLQIKQYQALFSLIGTTYGGDGQTTFALPDLRGRVPVGTGPGPGLTARGIGQQGGTEKVSLTTAQLPAHTHGLLASDAAADENNPAAAALAQTIDAGLMPTTAVYTKNLPDKPMHSGSIAATGGSAPHDNMPPFVALSYIICLNGFYPSMS